MVDGITIRRYDPNLREYWFSSTDFFSVTATRDSIDDEWDVCTGWEKKHGGTNIPWTGKIVNNILIHNYVSMSLSVSHWSIPDGTPEEATASEISLEKVIIQAIS
jgi:hypothetical protein